MNTAAPTTAHKKLVGILLTIVFALTCLPAALAVDLNVDAGFYFKQSRGGTCTLASAAMMLRRRAYFDGRTDWVDVTENSVRSTAWSNGLAHSFTYREMQVVPCQKASFLQNERVGWELVLSISVGFVRLLEGLWLPYINNRHHLLRGVCILGYNP